jgi:hypothetical protein
MPVSGGGDRAALPDVGKASRFIPSSNDPHSGVLRSRLANSI